MNDLRRTVFGLALAGCLGLAGCVTQEADTPPARSISSQPQTLPPAPSILLDETEIGVLPARELAAGECGLFLFTPRPTPRFVFYANAARSVAEMQVDGAPTSLSLVANTGTSIGQFYSESMYSSVQLGLTAEVTIKDAHPTEGGMEIGAGSIRLVNAEGWNVVIPVAGATACGTNG
ncbi:MAG: hypothetical protein MRY64_08690 [Hyphomonadaceae bacterium]|nr:hypothetical protein [Hyphomonadaceae bacterium]